MAFHKPLTAEAFSILSVEKTLLDWLMVVTPMPPLMKIKLIAKREIKTRTVFRFRSIGDNNCVTFRYRNINSTARTMPQEIVFNQLVEPAERAISLGCVM